MRGWWGGEKKPSSAYRCRVAEAENMEASAYCWPRCVRVWVRTSGGDGYDERGARDTAGRLRRFGRRHPPALRSRPLSHCGFRKFQFTIQLVLRCTHERTRASAIAFVFVAKGFLLSGAVLTARPSRRPTPRRSLKTLPPPSPVYRAFSH